MDIYEDMVLTEFDDYLEDEKVPLKNSKKSQLSCYSSKHTRIAQQQKQFASKKKCKKE